MKNQKPAQLDRRTFLSGLVATGTFAAFPSVFGATQRPRTISPNEKVNLACVGIGNRGADVVKAMAETGQVNIVALCDTQLGAKHTQEILKLFPDATLFSDFRTMFDKMGSQFDAVTVATPDHSHFPVAMLAMSQGKHGLMSFIPIRL